MLLWWSFLQWLADRVAALAAADACHTFFVGAEGSFSVSAESSNFSPLGDVELSVLADNLTLDVSECE